MKKISTLLFAGLMCTGIAFAQSSEGDMKSGEIFAQLDTNNDKVLSQQEAQGHADLASKFSTADANGDGYLTMAEFRDFNGERGTEESQ